MHNTTAVGLVGHHHAYQLLIIEAFHLNVAVWKGPRLKAAVGIHLLREIIKIMAWQGGGDANILTRQALGFHSNCFNCCLESSLLLQQLFNSCLHPHALVHLWLICQKRKTLYRCLLLTKKRNAPNPASLEHFHCLLYTFTQQFIRPT